MLLKIKHSTLITYLVFGLLSSVICLEAQAQKTLTLTTDVSNATQTDYKARDYVKLSSDNVASPATNFKVSSAGGKSFRFSCDPNIAQTASYNTATPNGNNGYTYTGTTPFSTTAPVGSSAGSADVSATGAAAYNFPIFTPMGTNGIQPSISIVYNSQGGNGFLGRGWEIGGLSSIVLTESTYKLDGTNLIPITGTVGAANTVYGVELENYNKIVGTADGLGFLIYTKEGKTLEYGTSTDARISGGSSIYTWRLNKVSDANGNYMTYTYGQENGESWISKIDYTGNTINGKRPYATMIFNYDIRNDKNTYYHKDLKYVQKRILTTISSFSLGELTRKYDFIYTFVDQNTQLIEIKETGTDGTSFNTKKVNWESIIATSISANNFINNYDDQEKILQGDFNGNGINDIFVISNTYLTTNRRKNDGYKKPVIGTEKWFFYEKNVLLATGTFPDISILNDLFAVDFDKDGKTELLFHYHNESNTIVKVYKIENGTSLVPCTDNKFTKYNLNTNFAYSTFDKPTRLLLGDFDNNKEIDYLVLDWDLDNSYAYGDGNYNAAAVSYSKDLIYYINLAKRQKIVFGVNLNAFTNNIKAYVNSQLSKDNNFQIFKNSCSNAADWGGDIDDDSYPDYTCKGTDGTTKTFSTTKYTRDFFIEASKLRTNPEQWMSLDTDADGTIELIGISQSSSQSYLLKANNNGAYLDVNATNSTLPLATLSQFCATENYQANYPCDVNGDGAIDFLTFSHAGNACGSFTNPTWNFYLNNGNGGYNALNINNAFPLNVSPTINKIFVQSVDVNLDGRQELVIAYVDLVDERYYSVDVIYFNGEIFTKKKIVSNLNYTNNFTEGINIFDYDNDGFPDLYRTYYGFYTTFGKNSAIPLQTGTYTTNLVKSVTDGLNQTTQFTYSNLLDAAVYEQNVANYIPPANTRFLAGNPLKVVKSIIRPLPYAANVAKDETIYKYYGMAYNTSGRGLLGFAKIEKTNAYRSILSIDEYSFTNYFPLLATNTIKNTTLDQNISSTSTARVYTTLPNNRFSISSETSISKDYLQNTRTETTGNIDNNGNITASSTIIYNNTTAGTAQSSQSASFEYSTAGTQTGLPNKITKTTTTSSNLLDGSSSITRITNYSYDATTGNILSKTEYVGQPNAITVNFSNHDEYGTSRTITTTAADVPTKVITTELDAATGRFVTKHTNPLGQISTKTYDPIGSVISETDIAGITLNHTYDGFGRLLTSTNTTTNVVVSKSLAWDNTSIASNNVATYKQTITATNAPQAVTYFNSLGKELRTQTQATQTNGQAVTWMIIDKISNTTGKIITQTQPYFEGSSSINIPTTTTTYDDFGRPISIVSSKLTGLSSTVDYTTTRTVKTTNYDSKTAEKTVNAVGKIISAKDNNGQTITYTYNSEWQLLTTTAIGVTTTIEYDAYGRQSKLIDPSAGTRTYKYDSYGRLAEETDPDGKKITYTYDLLDRLTQKTIQGTPTETITYTYQNGGTANGKLLTQTSSAGNKIQNVYNSLGLLQELQEYYGSEIFITKYEYDNNLNLTKITYPNTFAIKQIYSTIGEMTEVRRFTNDDLIWKLTSKDNLGRHLKSKVGKTEIVYEQIYGFASDPKYETVVSKFGSNFQNDFSYESSNGNIYTRQYGDFGQETFDYDKLDRLTTINGTEVVRYDDKGNITYKQGVGNYNYNGTPYALSKITGTDAEIANTSANKQTINYNTSNLVSDITEGVHKYVFTYGPDQQRVKMVYTNSTSATDKSKDYTRHYANGYEKTVFGNGNTRTVCYISTGIGTSAVYIEESQAGSTANGKVFQVLRDYQQTIIALADDNGNIIERHYYDAWGRKRNSRGTYTNVTMGLLSRGYTGQEHLLEIGLINLNARLYDPQTGRFLSPDPYIQEPDNSQNFNRYSYCVNNPLKFTDPSGAIFGIDDAIIIGIAIGTAMAAASYTMQIANSPGGFDNWSWRQFGMATLQGFLASAASAGVGGGFTYALGEAAVLTVGQTILKAAIHGLVQGGIGAVSGGNFWRSAASAAAGSLSAATFTKLMGGEKVLSTWPKSELLPAMMLVGGLSGGIASCVTGGSFQEGFFTGAIVAGLNDALHMNGGGEKTTKEKVDEFLSKITKSDIAKIFNDYVGGVTGIFELGVDEAYKGVKLPAGVRVFKVGTGSLGYFSLFISGTNLYLSGFSYRGFVDFGFDVLPLLIVRVPYAGVPGALIWGAMNNEGAFNDYKDWLAPK